MNFLSFFTGIGGLDLGLEQAGMKCVGQVEIDPFCRLVLRKHWSHIPLHDDISTLPADFVPSPDLICGGFPCQDISIAGKGVGLDGARSGLWFPMLAGIDLRRPSWVLVENVPALRTKGADTVLSGLEALGYTCWPLVVGARHVGAPHRRDRVFIVAHAQRQPRRERHEPDVQRGWSEASEQVGLGGGSQLAHSNSPRLREHGGSGAVSPQHPPVERRSPYRWPSLPAEPQHDWECPRLLAHSPSDGSEVAVLQQRDGRPSGPFGEAVLPGAGGPLVADPPSVGAGVDQRQLRGLHRETKLEGYRPSRETKPRLGGSVDGVLLRLASRSRRESLKSLGNAVVPQVAYAIGRSILQTEASLNAPARCV